MAGNYGFHGLNTDVLSILAFDDNAWRYAPRRLLLRGGHQAAPPRLYYKRTWHRETASATNMAKELSFESKFFVYLNLAHPAGSVRSHILQVLALNRKRLVFFLGVRLRFQKYDDPNNYVHIWISSRTVYPYDGRISLPAEQLQYCDDLLDGFWGCAVNQANSFKGRGSGWIFRSISQFDVRYAEAQNTGAVRYGGYRAAPRGIYASKHGAQWPQNKAQMEFREGSDRRSRPAFPERGSLFMRSEKHLATNGGELERNYTFQDEKVRTR
jgi:hypothetical protein